MGVTLTQRGGRALDPLVRRHARVRIEKGPAKAAPLPYEIHHGESGAKAHLVVASGELDLNAAPFMRETLASLVAGGRTHLVIDMSDATFIDSAMIGVFAAHLRATRGGAGSLDVVCSNENILRTLEIAGLDGEIQVLAALSDHVVEKVAALPRPHEHSKLLAVPQGRALKLRPDASQLGLARGFAVAAARRAGLDPRQQYNLAVATNEAVANAIRHGRTSAGEPIEVWADEGATALTVGVRNSGDFVLEPLSPDPLREGGRGLRLMSQMVDGISVQSENAHTAVELSVRR